MHRDDRTTKHDRRLRRLAALVAACTAIAPAARAEPTQERDDRGKSELIRDLSRTPSGFLYEWPFVTRAPRPLGRDWSYRFFAEFGLLSAHGDENAAGFRNYQDLRDGALLNDLRFALDRTGAGDYLDFTAQRVGRRDQTYRAALGRYGEFGARLHFSEIPRLIADRARSVFQGAGGTGLTLPAGLVPGNNSAAQLEAALQSTGPLELGFTRKSAGLDFEATLGAHARVFARYEQQRRKGTRPLGGAASYPGIPTTEVIEPIDQRTHNVTAGAQWASDRLQANLSYQASLFRNGADTLTWENPLTVDFFNAGVLQRGRIDLYPDNEFHNLKLEWGAALPMRGRLSGTLSWSRMTQDADLVAPTVNTGVLGGFPTVDLANWNTPAALSRNSADARIDTRLIQLAGDFAPLAKLSLRAKLRRYEEDNKTAYTAFNPLTGQSGYLGLDGGAVDIVPALLRVPVRSVPYAYRRSNYQLEADYRLLRRTRLTLGLEREDRRNAHREVGRSSEDRIRLALNNRDISWATLRLSYEAARRTGDGYAFDPNASYYAAASLLDAPPTLADLRKYDVANRRQQSLKARINFLLADGMDLALSGRYLDNDYDATYGRRDDRVLAFNLEWSWRPNPRASAYAHYGFERRSARMALINDDPGGYGSGDASAGGSVFPLGNRWNEDSRDDTHLVGLGLRYAFAHVTLDTAYSLVYAPQRIRYGFASGGALVGGNVAASAAGDAMPDGLYRRQALETSLRFRLGRETALRLYHRFERARYADWHYAGLTPVFDGGAGVFLGAGPRNYSVNVLGVFLQYAPGAPAKN